ncbi:hypothetical protein B9T64_06415 [Bacillus halotolerans]|uniref:hypothetical protein n=1 Tax=Bacillus halotolerans TaxID=260554 RepID=UPI000BFEE5D2|nr:hypothetical protein [Bacillus halotolerans]PHI49618.1 hypothetical protein B9T64_06415 [Bacillus halotolerans]
MEFYKVKKSSDLHNDLEYSFNIKGNFLKEMNSEISEILGIENAYSKIAYNSSAEPDLFINSKYKQEYNEHDLKKNVIRTGNKSYFQFKKSSKPYKAFIHFLKKNDLNKVVLRQDLALVTLFLHNLKGDMQFSYHDGQFWMTSDVINDSSSLEKTTETEYLEMKLKRSRKEQSA